jgi:hypothetical protein
MAACLNLRGSLKGVCRLSGGAVGCQVRWTEELGEVVRLQGVADVALVYGIGQHGQVIIRRTRQTHYSVAGHR